MLALLVLDEYAHLVHEYVQRPSCFEGVLWLLLLLRVRPDPAAAYLLGLVLRIGRVFRVCTFFGPVLAAVFLAT